MRKMHLEPGTIQHGRDLGDNCNNGFMIHQKMLSKYLTKYSQNLRKAASRVQQPIVEFIDAKLRKKKQPINKIINDNLKELCPLVDVRYSNVSPTTKPAKGKQDRQQIINRIFMRYNRVKNKK